MTLAQVLLFLRAAAIVAVSPGANNLLAFANGSRLGLIPAVVALSGRCMAFVIAVVIVGLGALLEASEPAFQFLKWAGVLYLAYLGVKMMIGRDCHEDGVSGLVRPVDAYSLARREFVTAVTNPKAILLFTAFVPQFIVSDAGASFAAQFVVHSAIYVAVEFVAAMSWAFAGSIIRSLHPSERKLSILNRVTGGMMLGAAVVLATARRA
nr:LysE family translocator [Pseudomonas sp. CFII64]